MMRILKYLLVGVALYTFFLIWRFPYQTLVERSIARVEQATGAKVVYTPGGASIFGVELKDVSVQATSGARMSFVSATLTPGFTGLTARLVQEKGNALVTLSGSQQLTLAMDNVDMETGSQEFGKVRVPKGSSITYNLKSRDGSGDIRLEVAKFQAPLPIPEMALEVGAHLQISNKSTQTQQGSEIRADVRLLGGTEFSANGPILVDSQPGGAPRLSGTLTFKTPLKSGTLRIEGNWPKPQWTIVPGN